MPRETHPYASRGGLKLAAALEAFGFDVAGTACADLGCSTGGFTDCLLQRGAAKIFAVDTAYGALAWKLRQDERVVVMERTNALHADPAETVDLVTIDLGWTRQRLAVPAALRWLRDGDGRIVTLIKPHYEANRTDMNEAQSRAVVEEVMRSLPECGARVLDETQSPLRGGKGANFEWLALLAPA